MQIKYTPQFLNKLEELFSECGYVLRYEKGNFKAGYCLLKDTRIAIVNRYFTTEGKINCLIEMLRGIQVDMSGFSDKNKKLYLEIVEFTS
ncbi:hypothetical protein GXP67_18140 [Rhodocytophaga rosea]|uniref:Uncharacterized protein n=1 Tax=Rhodocytophaga rosea TaxID=2704465 RepID=A0A6C0GV15_9BACT|nr:hypothetical protein GXP67_18140 [Rhodocytophaga rosea]